MKKQPKKMAPADATYRDLWVYLEVAINSGCATNAAIYATRLATLCAEPFWCERHGPDCTGVEGGGE